MAELNPAASHHVPAFITSPGETDVLMVIMSLFLVFAVLGFGILFLRLHTLPASRPSAQIWRAESAGEQVEDRPAYAGMLKTGELDRCGVTLLAGKAVANTRA